MELDKVKVDVIIPTYKPDDRLYKTVDRLLQQTQPVNQIYLINTIPADGTRVSVAERYKAVERVTVKDILQSEFNHGGTRNMGVELSDADYVVMMTQDAVPADKHLIEELLAPFAEDGVAASYARQLATEEVGVIEQYTRTFNYPAEDARKTKADLERLGIKTYFCSDVCAAYRKETYLEMGGFVTRTIFNEDTIMASKLIDAGYTVAYAARAKVFHAHKYTGKQQFQRNFDLGVSHREYREIFDVVSSESEGIKLVKKTIGYLCKQGKPWLIWNLIWQSGCKFLGYRLGKKYDRLPHWFVKLCSSQKSYWG